MSWLCAHCEMSTKTCGIQLLARVTSGKLTDRLILQCIVTQPERSHRPRTPVNRGLASYLGSYRLDPMRCETPDSQGQVFVKGGNSI
jgi:hypothetical protein